MASFIVNELDDLRKYKRRHQKFQMKNKIEIHKYLYLLFPYPKRTLPNSKQTKKCNDMKQKSTLKLEEK